MASSPGTADSKRARFANGRSGNLNAQALLEEQTESFWEQFELGRELGRGQFGIVYLCTTKDSGKQYAVKMIQKRNLITEEDIEDVKREIAILTLVAGHPNVVRLHRVFEDSRSIHMVMDACTGGELFNRILQNGHYSECAAAALMAVLMGVVAHCHSVGVMHRDLKPENMLLTDEGPDTTLKVGDFGLATFYKPGQVLRELVGSAYYVAPEVLKHHYGPEVDVWSAGVILYILLSGVPPFWAQTENLIFEEILHGDLDLESHPWPDISEEAKDLIRHMLDRNPKTRYSAMEVLQHPWIAKEGVASDKPLDEAVVKRLAQFAAMNRLKKMALVVIADMLSEDEIQELHALFLQMDTDKSGAISLQELKSGLQKHSARLADSEVFRIMEGTDVNHNGLIDYDEFIAATMQLSKMQREENLMKAFAVFDKDNTGFITVDELKDALHTIEGLSESLSLNADVDDILREIDTNGDGSIDYAEFCAMMRRGTESSSGGGKIRRRRHHSYKKLPYLKSDDKLKAEASFSFPAVPLTDAQKESRKGWAL